TYIIQFALPGVDPKAVEVSVMDNSLTIKGERKANHDSTGKEYFVREVTYGAFQRSVTLPEGVDVARGGSPRAARRDAEDDRSQSRLIGGGRAVPVPTGTASV